MSPQGQVLMYDYPPFNPKIRQQIEFNNLRLGRDELPSYIYAQRQYHFFPLPKITIYFQSEVDQSTTRPKTRGIAV